MRLLGRRVLLLLASGVVLGWLTGCAGLRPRKLSSDEVGGAREAFSPIRALENIVVAYREKDLALYSNQLHPNLTVRLQSDYRTGWEKQPGTDRDKDIASTKHIFELAERITCTMFCDPPVPSTVEGYPASGGYQEIRVHPLKMEITPSRPKPWIAERSMIVNDSLIYILAPIDSVGRTTWKVICEQTYWPGTDERTK